MVSGSYQPDRAAVAAFSGKLNDMVQSAVMLATAAVADRVGIFKLLSLHTDPTGGKYLTVPDICRLGGLHPRYVTEVCGCLACAGFIVYDEVADGFGIEAAQAKVLADEDFALFGGGWFDMVPALYRAIPGVTEAARNPQRLTGVPFAKQSEWGFSQGMDRTNGAGVKSLLARTWLPKALPQVVERLKRGISVADLGTGSGAAAITLAKAFPASTVVGIDLDQPSIDRANANNPGVLNLSFQCKDMATIEKGSFDLITNHDCIHDLVDPIAVLKSVRHALKPGGVFFSIEPRTLGETLCNNYASARKDKHAAGRIAMMYGISTLHCMTVSCAHGGLGLGSATFGPKLYERLAREAGFTTFKVVGSNPVNYFYELSMASSAL